MINQEAKETDLDELDGHGVPGILITQAHCEKLNQQKKERELHAA